MERGGVLLGGTDILFSGERNTPWGLTTIMLITSSVNSSQSGDSFQNNSYFTVIIHERGGGVKFVSLMIGVGNY